MSDGTLLNQGIGGDTIATEDIALGDSRGDAALPTTEYKIPRSKIAVGAVDQDLGDVDEGNPMPVRDQATLRVLNGIYEELRALRVIMQENLQR